MKNLEPANRHQQLLYRVTLLSLAVKKPEGSSQAAARDRKLQEPTGTGDKERGSRAVAMHGIPAATCLHGNHGSDFGARTGLVFRVVVVRFLRPRASNAARKSHAQLSRSPPPSSSACAHQDCTPPATIGGTRLFWQSVHRKTQCVVPSGRERTSRLVLPRRRGHLRRSPALGLQPK